MMIIRLIVVALGTTIGYIASVQVYNDFNLIIAGLMIGLLVSTLIITIEIYIRKTNIDIIIGGFLGLIISLISYTLLNHGISSLTAITGAPINNLINLYLLLMFTYIGIMVGIKKTEFIDLLNLKLFNKEEAKKNIKIFDTSVIIDGRIADISETGFIEGELVIPKFVLKELQQIADSADSLKRNRGRRGLEILQRMQKSIDLDIKIIDDDFPKINEVDTKLVALGQKLKGKIITNDYNLNKVAELQGVPVLNINQLANAVKPVVLPGELMKVHILREGKEYGQGIAYLDDGTMVVVDNAKKKIGVDKDVLVTSVLQTTAGRMIFAKLKEDDEGDSTN